MGGSEVRFSRPRGFTMDFKPFNECSRRSGDHIRPLAFARCAGHDTEVDGRPGSWEPKRCAHFSSRRLLFVLSFAQPAPTNRRTFCGSPARTMGRIWGATATSMPSRRTWMRWRRRRCATTTAGRMLRSVPARTTIISGLYPPSTGAEHMRSMTRLPDGFEMYPADAARGGLLLHEQLQGRLQPRKAAGRVG